MSGIQVQWFYADAADEADRADRSLCIDPSFRNDKEHFFVLAPGEFSAPGTIGLISLIRLIRVKPLNLDASRDRVRRIH